MSIKIAFIGAGYIARRHLQALQNLQTEIKLVGVTDVDLETAASFATGDHIPIYADVRELIDKGTPDAVYICIPPNNHGLIEQQLVEARIPFFVEKPLATDIETARLIARSVQRAGLPTGVGYHWRQLDGVQRVIDEIQRTEKSTVVAVAQWIDGLPGSPWWRRRESSGGQIVEQATHLIDVLRLALGDTVAISGQSTARPSPRAAAQGGDLPSGSAALLKFANGALGTIITSYSYTRRYTVNIQFILDGEIITVSEEGMISEKDGVRQEAPQVSDPFESQALDFLSAVGGGSPRRIANYSDALMTHELAYRIAMSCGGEQ